MYVFINVFTPIMTSTCFLVYYSFIQGDVGEGSVRGGRAGKKGNWGRGDVNQVSPKGGG